MRCLSRSHCAAQHAGGAGERVFNYTQLVGAGLILHVGGASCGRCCGRFFMCRSKTHLLLCFALMSRGGCILPNVKRPCALWAQIYKMLEVGGC